METETYHEEGQRKIKIGRAYVYMRGAINDYVVRENESIYKAYWIFSKNKRCVFVVGEDDEYIGILTDSDFKKILPCDEGKRVSELCNRKGYVINASNDMYGQARNIFSETEILSLPVVNENGTLVDYFIRERAFYRHFYKEKKLPRMHYAYNIWSAANEAKRLGVQAISVIEFGVAGGSGLVNCEFHAKEISRLMGVGIQVYGFDRETGMPSENEGYKDMIHFWPAGAFKMDKEILANRLEQAEVVLGEMKVTIPEFMKREDVAPIGTMLVDCDYYSSCKDVFDILRYEEAKYMPRIYMYFDDVLPFYEMQGESLAIREFNAQNNMVKISPENCSIDKYSVWSDKIHRLKICHRYNHPLYNQNCVAVNSHHYINEV